ncbi:MAG: thioredoxin domain-containing protein [Ginsengibacter sp.]|jgi:thioredoxin
MNRYLFILGFAFMTIMIGCNNLPKHDDNLDVQQFVEKMAATREFNLVDVRTPGEFEKGHLENAQNMDVNGNDFQTKIAKLDKNTPVFMYCLTDSRSKAAAEHLRADGYEVYMLKGGILKWRAEKLPEVADEGMAVSGMTMDAFQALLKSDKVVLVDFYAEWCGPCKKMEPFLKEISVDMQKDVELIRIDIDKNPVLAQQLSIRALPYLRIYKNNNMVWENLGFINKEGLVKQLNESL